MYRKKPVVIEAIQWTGTNLSEITAWVQPDAPSFVRIPRGWKVQERTPEDVRLIIPTLEGDHQASVGDFIIRGVKGEFYPCKPDIFAATYDAA